MKKIRLAVYVLFCVLFALCIGCQKDVGFTPKDSDSLWNKITETMKSLDNYVEEGSLEAIFYVQGLRFEATGDSYSVYTSLEGEPYSYMQEDVVVRCEEYSYKNTIEQVRAYYNGKLYLADKANDFSRKIYSDATFEAFEQAVVDDTVLNFMDLTDCTGKEFAREKDGTWSLKFSGYTKKLMDRLLYGVFGEFELADFVEDMNILAIADASFCLKSLEIKFVFEEDAGADVLFKATSTYSKYNEAVANPKKIQADTYTQVEDIYILEEIANQLEDFQKQKEGKFTLSVDQTVRSNGEEQLFQEIDRVTFGRENGKLYYNIDVDYDGTPMDIVYEHGRQTVSANGQSQEAAVSEEEAEQYLVTLLDNGQYDATTIYDITKLQDGQYRLKVAYCNMASIEAFYTENSGGLYSAKQTITVTFQEGKLTQMESTVEALGVIQNQQTTLTVRALMEYQSSGGEAV